MTIRIRYQIWDIRFQNGGSNMAAQNFGDINQRPWKINGLPTLERLTIPNSSVTGLFICFSTYPDLAIIPILPIISQLINVVSHPLKKYASSIPSAGTLIDPQDQKLRSIRSPSPRAARSKISISPSATVRPAPTFPISLSAPHAEAECDRVPR